MVIGIGHTRNFPSVGYRQRNKLARHVLIFRRLQGRIRARAEETGGFKRLKMLQDGGTLTDWVRRGLPRHQKRRERVVFIKGEVLDWLRQRPEFQYDRKGP